MDFKSHIETCVAGVILIFYWEALIRSSDYWLYYNDRREDIEFELQIQIFRNV